MPGENTERAYQPEVESSGDDSRRAEVIELRPYAELDQKIAAGIPVERLLEEIDQFEATFPEQGPGGLNMLGGERGYLEGLRQGKEIAQTEVLARAEQQRGEILQQYPFIQNLAKIESNKRLADMGEQLAAVFERAGVSSVTVESLRALSPEVIAKLHGFCDSVFRIMMQYALDAVKKGAGSARESA
jgi:hypothetical protein